MFLSHNHLNGLIRKNLMHEFGYFDIPFNHGNEAAALFNICGIKHQVK